MNPKPLLLAAVVSALIWWVAWCSLPPGPQPTAATPTIAVAVQPTTYVFVQPSPTSLPTPAPERLLTTPTHAVTQTAMPTQTALPTSTPEPTVAPSRSPIQRG